MALYKSLRIAVALAIFVAALAGIQHSALAACTSPDGIAGGITWNGTDSVIWCDGTNWYALKNAAGSSGSAGYIQFSNGSGGFSNSGTTAGQQFFWDDTNKRLGIGTTAPVALLNLAGNRSAASWTTSGLNLNVGATTLTDTTGTGTIATRVANSFSQPTLASSSAVTVTNTANVYIAGAPAAGTNTTITNSNALHVAAGSSYFGGNVGIFTTAPTYALSFGGTSDRVIGVERNTSGNAGRYLYAVAGGAQSAATDANGGPLYLSSGTATGTGSSNIIFRTATPQSATNTTDNAPSNKMVLWGNGNLSVGSDVVSDAARLYVRKDTVAGHTTFYTFSDVNNATADYVANIMEASDGANHSTPHTVTGLKIITNPYGSGYTNVSEIGLHVKLRSNHIAAIFETGKVGIYTTTPSYALSLGGEAARVIGVERPTTATNGLGLTINAGGAQSGGTDLNGGNLNLVAGTSTGAGSSNIYFQTAAAGATGTADRAPSTAMTILGNNNVGIGTTTPLSPLSFGAGIIAQKLNLYETALKRYGFGIQNFEMRTYMESDTNARLTWGTIDNADGTTWSEKMRLTAGGNVGIGTTTPTDLLHVGSGGYPRFEKSFAGAPTSTDCDNNAEVGRMTYDTTNNRWYVCTSASGWVYTAMGTSGGGSSSGSAGYVQFSDGSGGFASDSGLVWDNTNKRLGINVPSPSYDLSFGGGANRMIGMTSRSGAGDGFSLTLRSGATANGATDKNGGSLVLSSGVATGTGSSAIYFRTATAQATTNTTDNVPSDKMTILGNGNVGIGTTSPISALTIGETGNASGEVAANTIRSGSGGRYGIGFNTGVAGTFNLFGHSTAQQIGIGFDTGSFGTFSSVVTVKPSGNVGIGTTTPAAKLDVNGFMRLAKNGSAPATCDATVDGAIALTSQYTLCACKGGSSAWVRTSDGATACTW